MRNLSIRWRFTLFYSLIAGFNIPTIRTLIMLAVVQADGFGDGGVNFDAKLR